MHCLPTAPSLQSEAKSRFFDFYGHTPYLPFSPELPSFGPRKRRAVMKLRPEPAPQF